MYTIVCSEPSKAFLKVYPIIKNLLRISYNFPNKINIDGDDIHILHELMRKNNVPKRCKHFIFLRISIIYLI